MSTAQLSSMEFQNVFRAGVQSVPQKATKPDALKSLLVDAVHSSDAFSSILPTSQDEDRIGRTRQIMGEEVRDLTDEQLSVFLTEFNFLLDAWMDQYEQNVFDGKTLQQVLREG